MLLDLCNRMSQYLPISEIPNQQIRFSGLPKNFYSEPSKVFPKGRARPVVLQDQKHKSLLRFVRKLLDVAANLSKDDLLEFRSVAIREYPSVVPLIEEYLHLANRANTSVPLSTGLTPSR